MKTSFLTSIIFVTTLSLGIAIGLYYKDEALVSEASASSHESSSDPSPVKAVEPRYVYYPGTED